MRSRYLLYLDILGFAELVEHEPSRVDHLFRLIAGLNARQHESFGCICFSDTMLIYNLDDPASEYDHRYAVMYLCEFAQDLHRRLVGKGLTFRGLLTYGLFEHYLLDGMPCFYGAALLRAYRAEKTLDFVGLVMDQECKRRSDVFTTTELTAEWSYVHLTQGLDRLEDLYGGSIPLPRILVQDDDFGWSVGPEVEFLSMCDQQAQSHPCEAVRKKYKATMELVQRRYPRAMMGLKRAGYAMESLSDEFDWGQVRARFSDDYWWTATREEPPRTGW